MASPRATSSSPQRMRTGGSTTRRCGGRRGGHQRAARYQFSMAVSAPGRAGGGGIDRQLLGGERAGSAAALEDRPEAAEIAGADLALGQERELEIEQVAAAPALLAVVQEEAPHHSRVRDIEHRQTPAKPRGSAAPPTRRRHPPSRARRHRPDPVRDRRGGPGGRRSADRGRRRGSPSACRRGCSRAGRATTTRRPAAASAGICRRQPHQNSGKAVQQQDRRPSAGPASTTCRRTSGRSRKRSRSSRPGMLGGEAGQGGVEEHGARRTLAPTRGHVSGTR